uniref:Uncharacterized protein n=1 Tax=Romanomermis culicivorax TaxID=13658 RepID=A0A915IUT1_ROMCU
MVKIATLPGTFEKVFTAESAEKFIFMTVFRPKLSLNNESFSDKLPVVMSDKDCRAGDDEARIFSFGTFPLVVGTDEHDRCGDFVFSTDVMMTFDISGRVLKFDASPDASSSGEGGNVYDCEDDNVMTAETSAQKLCGISDPGYSKSPDPHKRRDPVTCTHTYIHFPKGWANINIKEFATGTNPLSGSPRARGCYRDHQTNQHMRNELQLPPLTMYMV